MTEHIVIPDTQIRPGVPTNHLNAVGRYIVHRKPEVIVMLGDFADMHSLSSYDTGKLAGEGARYSEDIAAARNAMGALMEPILEEKARQRRNKEKIYRPHMVLTLGNHENRINKHVSNYPVLQGHLATTDLGYEDAGWEVINFLDTVELDGILYSHYFPRNSSGAIVQSYRGAPNARVQVQREGQSCTAGHLQGLDFHIQQRGKRRDYGLIAGSFYMHEEDYLTPQGTAYWRGVIYKHQVRDGNYDAMFLSIDYLLEHWWDGIERRA